MNVAAHVFHCRPGAAATTLSPVPRHLRNLPEAAICPPFRAADRAAARHRHQT
jgi:hypothetical protein